MIWGLETSIWNMMKPFEESEGISNLNVRNSSWSTIISSVEPEDTIKKNTAPESVKIYIYTT